MDEGNNDKIISNLRDAALQLIPMLLVEKGKKVRADLLDKAEKEASDAWKLFASAALTSGLYDPMRTAEVADRMVEEWEKRFGSLNDDDDEDEDLSSVSPSSPSPNESSDRKSVV